MSAERADALRRWAEANGYGQGAPEAEAAPTVLDLPDTWRVDEGECIALMRGLPEASVDAIVTDPPYGLGFMGKAWDALPPGVEWAEECLRVLRPGGHLLAFGGTRTYHRLACAIEDAGLEIRDTVAWMYGSGFPKSHDVSKAIDKEAGAEREVVGVDEARLARLKNQLEGSMSTGGEWKHGSRDVTVTAPATAAAKAWQGWGTALKPAHEPVVVARKPLTGTVAANVLEHGTGALNVDGCRIVIPNGERVFRDFSKQKSTYSAHIDQLRHHPQEGVWENTSGRWPANVVLDEEAGRLLDAQTEGASRFFYCAKASRRERDAGLEGFEERKTWAQPNSFTSDPRMDRPQERRPRKNAHPTVKPVALMRYLVRLVTPPGGLVLDPFAGSGTTGIAAVAEGFRFLGLELDPKYVALARARIEHASEEDA